MIQRKEKQKKMICVYNMRWFVSYSTKEKNVEKHAKTLLIYEDVWVK